MHSDLRMINHQYRFIFIHIPRTAGKSVQKFFGKNWHNHKDISRYAQELEPRIYASYYKFAVVRNPWDRMLSDYNYQKKKDYPDNQRLFTHDERGHHRSFQEWLEAVLSDPFRYDQAKWGAQVSQGIHRWSPQVDWISMNGKIAVDRVLRMENLQEDFAELRRILGLPSRALPCRNWKFHWHYSYYYVESTKRLVENYYAKDIESFGYRFDSRGGNFRWFVAGKLGVRIRSGPSSLMQAK